MNQSNSFVKNPNQRYAAILDNLLEVTQNDPSVFTSLNTNHFYDFYKVFGREYFSALVRVSSSSGAKIELPFIESNLSRVRKAAESIEEPSLMLELFKNNDLELSDNIKSQLFSNFENTKPKLIEKIRVDIQKSALKWKILERKALSVLDETNIWPMHLGFLYVSVSIEDKKIYAPLFFHEVSIEFKNGRPFLIVHKNVKLNEKLVFILNNAGFNINITFDYSGMSIEQIIFRLSRDWNNVFPLPESIVTPFEKKNPDNINNKTIQFHTGMVLGIFLPGGGYSRKRMKEIIDNDEIDKIFNIDFLKSAYAKKLDKQIFTDKPKLFNITKTNFSQDRAILSSLIQDTVIWGPPGTGKSQTIVNLLANILFVGRTALVASQKKAALEVIRNRLQDLRMFCLCLLTSKDFSKRSFYEPLQAFIDYLEYFSEFKSLPAGGNQIIQDDELKWIEITKDINKSQSVDKILDTYRFLMSNCYKALSSNTKESATNLSETGLNKTDYDNLRILAKNVEMPHSVSQSGTIDLTEFGPWKKEFMRLNDKSNAFTRYTNPENFKHYRQLRKRAKEIENLLPRNYSGQISDFFIKTASVSYEQLEWVESISSRQPDYDRNELTEIENIKKIMTINTIRKITRFSPEDLQMYKEFAATIRLANMDPHKFIKNYGRIIKKIIPVVITTPDTDLSIWEKGEFDYVILDESSQIFIEKGLPLLYLGKTKILSGDENQMRPTNWFGVRSSDDTIFGNVESLLDYALSLGVFKILLDKNYRANHASLMTFSSKHFYKSQLDVVDVAGTNDEDAIEVIQVNGKWEDNKNIVEANKAIEILKENIDNYKKIILLSFNAKQGDYITNLIIQKYPDLEMAMRENRLMIRNLENIQGDEADLVVATVAYDKTAKIFSTYVGRTGGMNALNVAISRAKDKMIVIKTIKSTDISNNTNSTDTMIFRLWLEFLEKTDQERRDFVKIAINRGKNSTLTNYENNISEIVVNDIDKVTRNKTNVELVQNYSVGTLNIDLMVLVDKKPYKAYIFDDFSYVKNVNNFIEFKDKYKFLKSKNYDVKLVNIINWAIIKNSEMKCYEDSKILQFINSNYGANNFTRNNDDEEIALNLSDDFYNENASKDINELSKEWALYFNDEEKEEDANTKELIKPEVVKKATKNKENNALKPTKKTSSIKTSSKSTKEK